MKTINELLTDVYHVVQASLIASLDGEIYKNDARPPKSEKEDCVIRVIAGTTGKHTQIHALSVALFYKAHKAGDVITEDSTRGQALHRLLLDLCDELNSMQGYVFALDSREVYSEKIQNVDQYYAILRINFSTNK